VKLLIIKALAIIGFCDEAGINEGKLEASS